MKIDRLMIVPTGDELVAGIIADGNTPAIAQMAETVFPGIEVIPHPPVPDTRTGMGDAIRRAVDSGCDLAIFTGGSGGGKDFDPHLAEDCTHKVLRTRLDPCAFQDIYGYNGHLWARLVAGTLENTLFFNVPGPVVEAAAAAEAGLNALRALERADLTPLLSAMIAAVKATYPGRAG